MVKVILHPSIERMRGKMGAFTYRWMYGQQTLMKTPDMSNVKWSKGQKEHRNRFREAILYARQAMADPRARAHFEKTGKKVHRQPFRVAVSDFFEGKNLLEGK
jgi:hypothetical protein